MSFTTMITVGMGGIDRRSGLPPYLELAKQLRRLIESGELTGLLRETELAAQWRVGRRTVRKAFAILRDEGLIETRHGWGSRVLDPGERGGG